MLTDAHRCRSATFLFYLVGAVGCSTESDPTGFGQDSVNTMVEAALGATLTLADGTSVAIPAGALESDAEVSLSRETCAGVYTSERFQSCVYRVSAPGAKLDGRYALSIASNGRNDSPTDCTAALTDDGWRCLVDTEASEGSAAASASVFTDFTVRTLSDDIADDRCTDVPFEPCGGDLLGSWTLTGACGSMEEVTGATFSFDSPPYEVCDPFDYYMDFPFSVEASLEFADDGTLRTLETFRISGHTLVTEGCLAQVGEVCGEDCVLEDGVCDCVSLSSVGQHGSTDEWTPGDAGTFFYFNQLFQYCVEDDRLTVEFPSHGGESHLRVYERPVPDLLPIGTANCQRDDECKEGVCWDFRDADPACGGTVCSLECESDFDCQAAADEANGSEPAAATCGANGECDMVGTGLGSFYCE